MSRGFGVLTTTIVRGVTTVRRYECWPDATVVAAPQLLDVEVTQVLRRFVSRGHLDRDAAVQMVDDLTALRIERYDHRSLMDGTVRLWPNVTVYDAVYLVLAEALDAPLLTGDAALKEVPGCDAEVTVVPTTA